MAQPAPPNQKNPLAMKEYDKKREQAKKFRNEVVWVVILDEESDVREGCSWKVRRTKLTLEYLQMLVDHGPYHIKVDYLRDPTGEVVWPADMQLRCRPKPIRYELVDRETVPPVDAGDDPHYQGELAIVMSNVPTMTDDGRLPVLPHHLEAWLLAGVGEDYRPAVDLKEKIKKTKDAVAAAEKKVQRVGYLKLRDPQGNEIKGEKAERERQTIYEGMLRDKERLLARLEELEEELADIERGMGEQGLDIELDHTEEPAPGAPAVATYLCRFTDPDFGPGLADLVVGKDDWKGLRLAVPEPEGEEDGGGGGGGGGVRPWVGRGPYPEGQTPDWPDMRPGAADMKQVRLARLQHGFGTHRQVPSGRLDIGGPYFEFYHGQWRQGVRHGYGVLYSDEGVYAGNFDKGRKVGERATFDHASGDCHRGAFDCPLLHADTLLGANPYAGGVPHGEAQRTFADGATYTGTFVNGRIQGRGHYRGAQGDEYEGEFEDGLPHGQGELRTADGQVLSGRWVAGRLHGAGRWADGRGGDYRGWFRAGEKHGKGAELSKGSRYEGFFRDGARNGRGCLQMPLRRGEGRLINFDGEPPHLCRWGLRYEGKFLAGRSRGRGAATEAGSRHQNVWYTFNGEHQKYPFLSKLPKREERSRRALERQNEKNQRIDLYMRQNYEKRARRFFREQRRRALQALRQDAATPLDLYAVEARLRERETRIETEIKNWYRRGAAPTHLPLNLAEAHAGNWLAAGMDRLYRVAEATGQDPYGTVLSNVLQSDFEQFDERRRFLNRDFLKQRAEARAKEEGPHAPALDDDMRELLAHKVKGVEADGIRQWDPQTNTVK